jgi:hypothetical protein
MIPTHLFRVVIRTQESKNSGLRQKNVGFELAMNYNSIKIKEHRKNFNTIYFDAKQEKYKNMKREID